MSLCYQNALIWSYKETNSVKKSLSALIGFKNILTADQSPQIQHCLKL